MQGEIWNCYRREPETFRSMMQMIGIMERLFDSIHFPQAAFDSRTLIKESPKPAPAGKASARERMEAERKAVMVLDKETIMQKQGDEGTFVVHVQYRQNATWQGNVVWAEKKISKNFRSALELIKMIDGALEESSEAAWEKRQ